MKALIALAVATITLSLTPKSYHVTYTGHADEVHLVIQSASGTSPYRDIEAIPLGKDVESIDFVRHKLPTGSYTIIAELWQWRNNELVVVETSTPPVIIHIPKK